MKINNKKRYIIYFTVFTVIASYLVYTMYSAYEIAKKEAVNQLYSQEYMLALQAKKNIENYFNYLEQTLTILSASDDLIDVNSSGKSILEKVYESQKSSITNISRMDSSGKIIYSYPDKSVIGSSIANQEHVRKFLKNRKPTLSSVFSAIQGYKAVALHVPVYKNGKFDGSYALLIPFKNIAARYLENIRIGKAGYAFLINSKAIELYCPVPGHLGLSDYHTSNGIESFQKLIKQMAKGKEGRSVYEYDLVKESQTERIKKYAYYMPVSLPSNFWSICVTAPESDAVEFIKGFQNRFLIAMISLICALIILAFILYKMSVKIIKERNKHIAQQKIAEAETEKDKAHALLNVAVLQSPVGIIVVDANNLRIILANKAAYELKFGKTANVDKTDYIKLLGDWNAFRSNSNEIINKKEYPLYRAAINGEIINNEEYTVHAENNELKYVSVSAAPVYDSSGKILAAITMIHDITDNKDNETQRQKLEQQLIQAQKLEAIGRLAGGVAHDFNNMLTPILGFTELMLLDSEFNAKNKHRLNEILKAVMSSRDLVRQLLAFARKQNLELKVININKIIENFQNILERTLRENIKIHYNLKLDIMPIKADIGQIEQIIMNLCVNSQDAMPNGGDLFISTSIVEVNNDKRIDKEEMKKGEYLLFSISDTGMGIEKDVQKMIFEPFFSTKPLGLGTGLGLATVHGIVKQHGGHISLYSELGMGTSFKMYFPVIQAENQDIFIKDIVLVNKKEKGEGTILLVEDNLQVREMSAEVLSSCGYNVLEAACGEEALLAAKENGNIIILVTDVILPDINGKVLYSELLKLYPNLKVLFMSGYTSDVLSGRIGLSMDLHFIQKPFSLKDFSYKVKMILEK